LSRYSSADFGFLCIGHYDLTNISTKFEDSISRPMIDSTPYGTASATVLPGLFKTYELTGHEGWYDDSTYSINAAMVDLAVGANTLMVAPFGNTAPVAGVGCKVIANGPSTASPNAGTYKTAFKRSGEVGDYHKASFEVAISGIVDQGTRLVAPLISRGVTGTTSTSYLDCTGAAGTVGGRVYLVVTDISWATRTSLAIKLQDCATTGGTYVDHTAFTSIVPATTPTGSGTSELKALANASINRYTCVTWTWAGGSATSETVSFAVAVTYD
jgi:hypothetical protein